MRSQGGMAQGRARRASVEKNAFPRYGSAGIAAVILTDRRFEFGNSNCLAVFAKLGQMHREPGGDAAFGRRGKPLQADRICTAAGMNAFSDDIQPPEGFAWVRIGPVVCGRCIKLKATAQSQTNQVEPSNPFVSDIEVTNNII